MKDNIHRYETVDEALEELGRRQRRVFRNRLNWAPPYDDTDLEEVLKPAAEKTKRRARQRVYRPRLMTRLQAIRETQPRHVRGGVEGLRKLAEEFRKEVFGISEPIPLSNLYPTLQGMVTVETSLEKAPEITGLACPYYLDYLDIRGCIFVAVAPDVWLPIRTVEEKGRALTLASATRAVSLRLACHPALALAFLMCDTPVHSFPVTAVIEPTGAISVSARPQAPASAVREAYFVAKKVYSLFMGRERTPKGNWPKLRGQSRRVASLVQFVNANRTSDWAGLMKKWNNDNSQWGYLSVNSMRTVYYRAVAEAMRPGGEPKKSRTTAG